MKTWKPFEDNCLHCGASAEVHTDSKGEGMAYDGDEARCAECKCPGSVNVYEEPNANISWHDEPDCDCGWCKAHPQGNSPASSPKAKE